MKITNIKKLRPKKLIVFDLDGTVVKTKSVMDPEMTVLMAELIKAKKVAIIGGGKYSIFQSLLLHPLKTVQPTLENLYLFPTTGTAFYRYRQGWKNVYAQKLTKQEISSVMQAFKTVFAEINYVPPKKVYGKVIENRGDSQITFSALGQDVVKQLGKKGIKMKEEWREKNKPLRMKITRLLSKYLPKLEVRAAAFTSIDITKKGIDKAYGIRQMEKYLKVKIKDMLFVGDAIFPGGNDYAVVRTDVDYIPVKGPVETKTIIRHLLKTQ